MRNIKRADERKTQKNATRDRELQQILEAIRCLDEYYFPKTSSYKHEARRMAA